MFNILFNFLRQTDYLSENIDEMACQKEITNPTRNNYSYNFQESEIGEYIEEYNKEASPKIIESNINQISKKYLNFHKFYIIDLTIQNSNVKIDHCSLKSTINVYSSTLTVFYSIFTPLEQSAISQLIKQKGLKFLIQMAFSMIVIYQIHFSHLQ